jgi:hypothetical protein
MLWRAPDNSPPNSDPTKLLLIFHELIFKKKLVIMLAEYTIWHIGVAVAPECLGVGIFDRHFAFTGTFSYTRRRTA